MSLFQCWIGSYHNLKVTNIISYDIRSVIFQFSLFCLSICSHTFCHQTLDNSYLGYICVQDWFVNKSKTCVWHTLLLCMIKNMHLRNKKAQCTYTLLYIEYRTTELYIYVKKTILIKEEKI